MRRTRSYPSFCVAVALTATLAAGIGAAVLSASPAGAAPAGPGQSGGSPTLRVSQTSLAADRVSTVTVTGTNYLVPPHAPGTDVFGGIYVFFGWVAGGDWGPSARNSQNDNGTFGATYAYPGDGGDPGTRGDDGAATMRLVAFTSGGESGNATDFHMDRDGNWTTTLRVYGSTFVTTDPITGESRTYDCQQVQCGVFTVGAHGKASATNERFTPINFTGSPPATPIVPGGGPAPGGARGPAGPDAGGAAPPSAGPAAAGGGGAGGSAAPTGATGATGPAATADVADGAADEGSDGAGGGSSGRDDEEEPLPPTYADGETLAIGIIAERGTGDLAPLRRAAFGAGVAVVVPAAGALGLWRLRRRRRRRAAEAEPAAAGGPAARSTDLTTAVRADNQEVLIP